MARFIMICVYAFVCGCHMLNLPVGQQETCVRSISTARDDEARSSRTAPQVREHGLWCALSTSYAVTHTSVWIFEQTQNTHTHMCRTCVCVCVFVLSPGVCTPFAKVVVGKWSCN